MSKTCCKWNPARALDLISRAAFTYMTALMFYTAGNLLCFVSGNASPVKNPLTLQMVPDVMEHVLMSAALVCGAGAAVVYLLKQRDGL